MTGRAVSRVRPGPPFTIGGAADATGVPRRPGRARAAVEAFGAAGDEGERVALAEVGRVVRAVHEARLAASAEAQRLAAGQRARQGARLKP